MSYNEKTVMSVTRSLEELKKEISEAVKDTNSNIEKPLSSLKGIDSLLSIAINVILEKTQLCDNLENHIKELKEKISLINKIST